MWQFGSVISYMQRSFLVAKHIYRFVQYEWSYISLRTYQSRFCYIKRNLLRPNKFACDRNQSYLSQLPCDVQTLYEKSLNCVVYFDFSNLSQVSTGHLSMYITNFFNRRRASFAGLPNTKDRSIHQIPFVRSKLLIRQCIQCNILCQHLRSGYTNEFMTTLNKSTPENKIKCLVCISICCSKLSNSFFRWKQNHQHLPSSLLNFDQANESTFHSLYRIQFCLNLKVMEVFLKKPTIFKRRFLEVLKCIFLM